jgi:hypothetical protein
MSRRVIVGSFVVLAVALVLWMKPSTSTNGTAEVQDPVLASVATQVLLFADPREAESSCGCGQIIRMVRGADVPGVVAVQEFDPQRESEAARVHSVRVNPTVIIARGDGVEQARFEGESPDVIAGVRGALATLTSGTVQPADEGSP